MKTFLQDLADTIKTDYADWEKLTVVFPNRRAALYFKRALSKNLSSPHWSPTVITIEDFIGSFTTLQEADKLSLILKLYQAFKKVTNSTETLDQFYYWGEMLLRDFDELDKYLVNPEFMFRDVSNLKEVDQYFDYLTEEQKGFLKDFWQSVEFSTPETKERFLTLWRNLFPVYQEFRQSLLKENTAYAGMIHRTVADYLMKQGGTVNGGFFVFAGFNALTTAEEKIICWFVENQNAKVFWDEDEFYVNSLHREAGTFFRLYRKHPVLGKTFTEKQTSFLLKERKINIIGVPQKAGQPKLLAQRIAEAGREEQESMVIVLPDESLLMPLLYSLPPSLTEINVTMGFPLVSTPYFSLIDFLFDLHRNKRKEEFYFRPVMALLNHPYLKATVGEEVTELRDFIVKYNQVYLTEEVFASKSLLLASIFRITPEENFISYLLDIITQLATSPANGMLEKEFAFYFHRLLSKLQGLATNESMGLIMLQRLFRQIARSEKVPFSGEPLKGIQIMGILETRNLDFDLVNVLSLNEGLWPAAAKQGSYIPHSIRKAYSLPTYQHQDSMYAYLFYRLLQRTQRADLYYNTEPDILGSGEMSRYLYQLMYETCWPYEKKILYSPVSVRQPQKITILKDASVQEKLTRYIGKELTPSTLNNYLDCRLKFYFKNLIGLKDTEEVEEDADARIFGNIFHDVMQFFYADLKPSKGSWAVKEEHFENLSLKLDTLVERAYRKHFGLPDKKKVQYEGQQLIVNEMVKRMALQVLESDKAYVPFVIEMLEENNFKTTLPIREGFSISIGGKIDRVDRKGETIRIIDYKTGRDINAFDTITSLFDYTDKKRNKAAFQAVLYAWVYNKKRHEEGQRIQPGLVNRKEIFKEGFQFGLFMNRQRLENVIPLLPEFEDKLVELLTELFNPSITFDQTEDLNMCKYCSFKEICGR